MINVNITDLKSSIKSDLLFILDNRSRCVIEVVDNDINNVYSLLESGDYDSLLQCHNEMDDIINGIIINIDNELKKLLDESNTNDINCRTDILNKIISISNSIRYEESNKAYFMGIIKKIYSNIDGDKLFL